VYVCVCVCVCVRVVVRVRVCMCAYSCVRVARVHACIFAATRSTTNTGNLLASMVATQFGIEQTRVNTRRRGALMHIFAGPMHTEEHIYAIKIVFVIISRDQIAAAEDNKKEDLRLQ